MSMRALSKILVTSVTLALLSACTQIETFNSSVIRGSDLDIPIVKSQEDPRYQRVITIASGSYEILRALSFERIVVGIGTTEKSVFNETLPVVTSGHEIDLERVLRLNPDLILFDETTSINSSQAKVFDEAGIELAKLDVVTNLTQIANKIDQIASVLNTKKSSQLLIAKLEDIKIYPKNNIPVLFLYLRGSNSIYLLGGKGSGADDLIHAAGGIDVGAEKLDRAFAPLTPEAVVTLNPEVLLVMEKGLQSVGGVDGLIKLPGIAQTKAAKAKNVIVVEDETLLSFGVSSYALVGSLNSRLVKYLAQD